MIEDIVKQPIGILYDGETHNWCGVSGPSKLLMNTIQGLEQIGCTVMHNKIQSINGAFLEDRFLLKMMPIPKDTLIGPCMFPQWNLNSPIWDCFTDFICASERVRDHFKTLPYTKGKYLHIWSVGIDTELFQSDNSNAQKDCLIYFKKRSEEDLNAVIELLVKNNLTYTIVAYGGYQPTDLIPLCSNHKFCIIVACPETQGIGYMEILSCGLPCFVVQPDSWDINNPWQYFSTPYFSDDCGLISNMSQISNNFPLFIDGQYNPRKYIVDNHSLEIAAQQYVNILHSIHTRLNYEDITVVAVVRIDHPDRRMNLEKFIDFFHYNFPELIINIVEVDTDPKLRLPHFVNHIYVHEPADNLFNKAKYLNIGYNASYTKFIYSADIDILPSPDGFVDCMQKLSEGYKFAIPYNGEEWEIENSYDSIRDIYNNEGSVGYYKHPYTVGGALFFDFNAFLSVGLENEKFSGWGCEDDERIERIAKFHPVYRSPHIVYHLKHSIRNNPTWCNDAYLNADYHQNKILLDNMRSTSSEDMQQYIQEIKEIHGIFRPDTNVPIKYSILMPYYNKLDLLEKTFNSYIKHNNRSDYEFVIVESYNNQIDPKLNAELIELIHKYKYKIRVQHLVRPQEFTGNPSVSFNQAAQAAQGDFIVLTNPDCMVESNIFNKFDDIFAEINNAYIVCACLDTNSVYGREWCQHSLHYNRMLHWLTCITKYDFMNIGGFDEAYTAGIGFEDDDFAEKVKASSLKIVYRDDIIAIHQFHTRKFSSSLYNINCDYFNTKWQKNEERM